MKYSIDELLEKEYWIADILPQQVPPGSKGQYFAIEEYYFDQKRISEIHRTQPTHSMYCCGEFV